MTVPTITGFDHLKARVAKIKRLLDEAAEAKRLPDVRHNVAMSARLKYGQLDDATCYAFRVIKSKFADDERRQGEIARDRELKRLAYELDKARADLAVLGQAACFDLLDYVREWRS